mmetsp:Transcript_56356/g.164751  ORF Transcript_56356/g.164751 Transcript_56356/m.164751 type:complete len:248 (+) Transcript_56356:861-1604(+)
MAFQGAAFGGTSAVALAVIQGGGGIWLMACSFAGGADGHFSSLEPSSGQAAAADFEIVALPSTPLPFLVDFQSSQTTAGDPLAWTAASLLTPSWSSIGRAGAAAIDLESTALPSMPSPPCLPLCQSWGRWPTGTIFGGSAATIPAAAAALLTVAGPFRAGIPAAGSAPGTAGIGGAGGAVLGPAAPPSAEVAAAEAAAAALATTQGGVGGTPGAAFLTVVSAIPACNCGACCPPRPGGPPNWPSCAC